jgi:hypothetical protein
MIDVQALDRTGRRQVLHGLLAQYNLGSESAKVALGMAHQNLPGFTALMERNIRLMRPGAAMEKTLQAVLARPAKPKFRRVAPEVNHNSVRCIGLDKLKF